jgi:hypothetical protein
MKYDFILKSGHVVVIDMEDLKGTIDRISLNLVSGSTSDFEWITDVDLQHTVRWSEIAGWQPHVEPEVAE